MDTQLLLEDGAVIAYVLVGVIALVGLGIIQVLRRRGDVKRARVAVRLASHSISALRLGPIAVTGSYRETKAERSLDCGGQRVVLDGTPDVQRGTRARWHHGVRTYTVRDGDPVIAIGIMSKPAGSWRLAASAGESGVQLFATKPTAAPRPLWPWRAPLILAVWGAIGYFGLYGIGTLLLDLPRTPDAVPCTERPLLRLAIATALPLVREQALTRYRAEVAHCGETPR